MAERALDRMAALVALCLIAAPAWAAPDVATSIASVGLSLVLILAGFIALAWFARRYVPGAGKSGVVRVMGSAAVGTRERVVVVEVDGTRLVLGVASGSVRLLHTAPAPAPESASSHGEGTR